MNFDFELILFSLTLISGLVCLSNWLLNRVRERTVFTQRNQFFLRLIEYAKSFFPVFLAVLIIRSFIIEPFRIPSGSMIPTLLIGDFIVVNKFTYGIRLPVVKTKILANNTPSRGDVVVFRFPLDPSIPFIKRVLGLPGDEILYKDKKLFINGRAITYSEKETFLGKKSSRQYTGAEKMTETHSEGSHMILIRPDSVSAGGSFKVPEGQYFVLGDNRDNSRDSRFWGFVPEENLVGKAFMIWMNWDAGINVGRIGNTIR